MSEEKPKIIPDVASEALDYMNIKRRAVASRNFRIKLAPSNGSSFTPSSNSVINLDMPSNLAGTFVDFTQSYLKFKLTPDQPVYLDKAGAFGVIQKFDCVTSGQQIYSLNNYNVLMAALMDIDSSDTYKSNVGKILCGTQGAGSLGEFVPTAGRTFALPFALHPLAMQKKLVPLFSLDSLRFRLTLESAVNALIQVPGETAQQTYTVSNVELCMYLVELSPAAAQQVNAMTGGVYQMLCPCYQNYQSSVPAASTAVTTTLGIAVSSLERIIVIHRANGALVAANQSLGGRITNGLSSFFFTINGEQYPARPVEIGDAGAEPLAELLVSDHALSDFNKGSHITSQFYTSALTVGGTVNASFLVGPNEALYQYLKIPATSNVSNAWFNGVGTGTLLANNAAVGAVSGAGSFIAAIELESGVSAGKSDRIYSGISTMASVVQYNGTYAGGGTTVAATVDFFCHYTIMLTLNMNTVGVWVVSL